MPKNQKNIIVTIGDAIYKDNFFGGPLVPLGKMVSPIVIFVMFKF